MHAAAYKSGSTSRPKAPATAANSPHSHHHLLTDLNSNTLGSKQLAGEMGSNKGAAAPVLASFVVWGLLVLGMMCAQGAAAASCDATALSPCLGAITLGGPVTAGCCARLRMQQPCLCQYARDPTYRGYVNSPRAQSVVRACGLPKPKC